jgi:hypothetical protein
VRFEAGYVRHTLLAVVNRLNRLGDMARGAWSLVGSAGA